MGFNKIARFYHLLSDESLRLSREGTLLLEILHLYGPSPRVLDLACGTGVHSRYLVGQHAGVVAMDISPEMLHYAKSQEHGEKVNYVVADFNNLPFKGQWDFIMCLGNSICLLTSHLEIKNLFQQVASLLGPNGIFMIQILNYNHADMKQIKTLCTSKKLNDNENVIITKTFIPDEDVVFLSINYFVRTRELYSTANEANVLLKLSMPEVKAVADGVSLYTKAVYGDFQKNDFIAEISKDLIMLFSKS
ncbi:MAG TPA: class I SAM-dependent methyltransferase [Candidatus Hydrogenedens sp.]|nr:class I SAM-dependent methyltransferase [Candidatus Hydrogenedens sp.]